MPRITYSNLYTLPNYKNKEECLSFINQWKDDLKVLLFFRQDLAEEYKERIRIRDLLRGLTNLPSFVPIDQLKDISEILIKCSERIDELY